MSLQPLIAKVGRYGLVGVAAALVHAAVLLLMGLVAPLWISNLCGFLTASLVGYLGHARYTFRPETKGQRFARRWLVLQFAVNVTVSAVLPLVLGSWIPAVISTVILVFTPTVLNALIWSRAARFSLNRQQANATEPVLHADDLGLTKATNTAILELAQRKQLSSASLMVNGTAVDPAVEAWAQLPDNPKLCLHICLTEGPALAGSAALPNLTTPEGLLNRSFAQLLLASCMPRSWKARRKLEQQLRTEIRAQAERFQSLTAFSALAVDGHQHIHLVPIVLDVILELSKDFNIYWIRNTAEALPPDLPWGCWQIIFTQGGWLKWLILQGLTQLARPRIRKLGISTNAGFAGVLFTGRMAGLPIQAAWMELKSQRVRNTQTAPVLLAHPAAELAEDEWSKMARDFPLSLPFVSSSWRQQEWAALGSIQLHSVEHN